MSKLLLSTLLVFCFLSVSAQEKKTNESKQEKQERYIQEGNPFQVFGYKPKIATLSKGKYREFFTDTIVQIGSFTYNRVSKNITGVSFVENKGVSEADLRPDLVSRWFSPDPLSDEFPSWSNFVEDNPIRYNDPLGLSPNDVVITGDKSKQAFKQLNQSTSLDLSMDDNGNVTAQGNAVTQADQDLLTAINDHTVVVNVDATKDNYTASGNWFVGGAFGGSTVDANGITQVTQTVNPKHTKQIDKFYGSDKGVGVLHEVLEGYSGGANSPGNGAPTFADVAAGNAVAQGYLNAHNAADTSDPRHIPPTISQDPTSGHLYINKLVPNPISPLLPQINVEKKINNLKHKR